MKVLVKDRKALNELTENFIAENIENFSKKGLCSVEHFRNDQNRKHDFIAGKEIRVEKVIHADNIGFHYVFEWFKDGNQCYYGNIDLDEIVKEIV